MTKFLLGRVIVKIGNVFLGLTLGLLAAPSVDLALAGEASAGKALYDKQCVSCHAADGKGNPDIAKVLGDKGLNIVGPETTKKTDAQLLKIITEGAGKMPPSKGLSKEEEKAILSFTRGLGKTK